MFGIINNDSKFCLALNHLVIIGKYFLYVKVLDSKFYIFYELFVSLARDINLVQKNIFLVQLVAKKSSEQNGLLFSSLLNTVWNSVYLTDCAPI